MKPSARLCLRGAALLGLLPFAPINAQPPSVPTLVVLPSGQQTTDGNYALNYPWDLTSGTGATSLRYQQVYDASDFGSNSGTICQIGFRVAPASSSGTAFNPISIPSVTIILSTTSKTADGLSKTFSSNTGSNAVTVYSGPLTVSSSDTLPPGTNAGAAFDTRVDLQTPYSYDPASGNLLMDLKIKTNSSSGVTTSPFDGQNTTGDSISRVYATSSTATTATVSDSKGVVTQFMFGNTRPVLGGGISWFLENSDFVAIQSANSAVASANFNNSQTYIMTGKSTSGSYVTSVPAGWSAIGGIKLQSFAALQTAVSDGMVATASASANLEALTYDNESWTPTAGERTQPALYEALFANLAHAYGYTYFSTPALDIMTEQSGYGSYPSDWVAYLNLDCPSSSDLEGPYGTTGTTFPVFSAAAPADIYELQSEALNPSINVTNYSASDYNVFVTSGTMQALDTNSKVIVFAGLSPYSAGGPATIDQLYESVADSASAGISGYWLNTPADFAAESVELLQRLDAVNVTSNVSVTQGTLTLVGSYYEATVTVQNTSSATINGPIQVIFGGLNCTLENAAGTFGGNPYYTASTSSLGVGDSAQFTAEFNSSTPSYSTAVYSGTF